MGRVPPDSRPRSGTARGRVRARSLAEDLRTRSDDEIAALLTARPDLAHPAPADLTTLAARAGTPASARRALDDLDTAHLRALQAAVVCGDPVDEPAAVALLACSRRRWRELLDGLRRRVLVWQGADGAHVHGPVAQALGPHVAGLAAPSAEDAALQRVLPPGVHEPHDLIERLDDLGRPAPDGAADILRRLTWGPPLGTLDATGPLGAASRRLVGTGLLREGTDAPGSVVLPRPVALALRGGRLFATGDLEPPQADLRPGDPEHVDAGAGARAGEVLTLVEEILDQWGTQPPRVLRSGGLAVRDLTRLAGHLDVRAPTAALLVEVARAAGLVREDGAFEPLWAPTAAAEDWLEDDDAHRWSRLVLAWLGMPAAPHLVGTRTGERGGAVNALSPDASWAAIRGVRTDVLTALAQVEPGTGATVADVVARVRWRRPLRAPTPMEQAASAVISELDTLGLTSGDALAGTGRALLEAPRPTATALDGGIEALSRRAAIPAPVEEVLLQADLTAVAPGRLTTRLASFLRLAADVESRGGATVYRFTPRSLQRLLDEGWAVDDVLRTLAGASRTPVPQPLDYLVRDLGKRHGQARVGGAGSYVRSDDEALLDRILASPGLSAAGLRRLAPTVLVSGLAGGTLLQMLRDQGLSPVAEGPDGALVVGGRERHRAPAPAAASAPPRLSPDDVTGIVARMRQGETARIAQETAPERVGPAIPACDPVVSLGLLRQAMAEGEFVWLGHAESDGATTRLRFRPTRITGGTVHGTLENDATRTLSVHRITGVVGDL